MILKLLRLQNIPQVYHVVSLCSAPRCRPPISWNRGLDTDIRGRQTQLDVVGQSHDPAHLHALLRMELIPRDRGTAADIGHSYAHTKILQCLLQLDSGFPVFLIRERAGALSFFSKCDRREDVLLLHHFLLLLDLLDHAEISCFLFLFLGLLGLLFSTFF